MVYNQEQNHWERFCLHIQLGARRDVWRPTSSSQHELWRSHTELTYVCSYFALDNSSSCIIHWEPKNCTYRFDHWSRWPPTEKRKHRFSKIVTILVIVRGRLLRFLAIVVPYLKPMKPNPKYSPIISISALDRFTERLLVIDSSPFPSPSFPGSSMKGSIHKIP